MRLGFPRQHDDRGTLHSLSDQDLWTHTIHKLDCPSAELNARWRYADVGISPLGRPEPPSLSCLLGRTWDTAWGDVPPELARPEGALQAV